MHVQDQVRCRGTTQQPEQVQSDSIRHVQLLSHSHRLGASTNEGTGSCSQIRELLKRKRFDAALALIASCRAAAAAGGGGGSPPSPLLLTHGSLGGDTEWLDTALVQAGLLMLQARGHTR